MALTEGFSHWISCDQWNRGDDCLEDGQAWDKAAADGTMVGEEVAGGDRTYLYGGRRPRAGGSGEEQRPRDLAARYDEDGGRGPDGCRI